MFISADKIIDLIQVCRDVKERMAEDSHRVHVDDIAGCLQKLIDDEVAELDRMAAEFESQEDESLNEKALRFEEERWGLLQLQEAATEKELEIDFNWPGGV